MEHVHLKHQCTNWIGSEIFSNQYPLRSMYCVNTFNYHLVFFYKKKSQTSYHPMYVLHVMWSIQ